VQDHRSAERGQFTFVQGVVRQVAYATQSKRDRKARHLAAAEYLEGLVIENEDLSIVVAQHLLDAVDASSPGDDDGGALTARACSHLERAAQRAAALAAPSEAVRLYRAALEHADEPATQGRLHLAAARAANVAGDYTGAVEHAAKSATAFDLIDAEVDAGMAVGLQCIYLARGSLNVEAIDLARPRWDALVTQPGAERALVELAAGLSMALHNRGDLEEAFEMTQRQLMLAEATGNQESIAYAVNGLALLYGIRGAPITSRGLTALAAQIARENDLSVVLSLALNNLGSMLVSRDLPEAIRVVQEGLEVARRASTASHVDYTTSNYLNALWNAGRLPELRVGLLDAKETVTTRAMAAFLVCLENRLAEALGEPLPPVADMAGMEGENDTATRLDMEVGHAMADGDAHRAAALAEESLPHLIVAMGIDDDFVTMWPPLVEAALAAGDVALAERLLAPVETAPTSIVSPGVRAHWLRLRGLLGALRGDHPEAVEADLRAGIAELDAYGAVGYRARAQEDLGRWLTSRGRGSEATPLLDAARATYEEIDAAGWLARLDASLPTPLRVDR